ncbi:MAG: SGNH/GDSL hydrolase family protein [Planctomycetota bacterium]
MHQRILVYGDSLSWGIIPESRDRLGLTERWPGVLHSSLQNLGLRVQVIENCLNGRTTNWDDPQKAGRNGLVGVQQVIESNVPLELVILMLGSNDFQSGRARCAGESASGIARLVDAIRKSPIEASMSIPPTLVVTPPPITEPKGWIATEFGDAAERSVGLANAYKDVANDHGCTFFDSASVITTSIVDGVHLDVEQHRLLGRAIAQEVTSCLPPD